MSSRVISSTTQEFLDIHDITNNMVIMKDGSVSAILSVYAMNFSLLAEEEQDAVIYAYAALLNSLNYSIQINIQSKTKDATKYLDLLKKQQEKASSRDKAARIGRYQDFVSKLIQERNVLDKKFYVVIPANAIEMGIMPPSSFMSSSSGKNAFDINTIERSVILEKAAGVLEPRVAHLIGQFNRIGLFAKQLNTQEIIQIFYINYNPEAAEGQQLVESSDYSTPLVRASVFKTSLKNDSTPPAESPIQASTQQPEANVSVEQAAQDNAATQQGDAQTEAVTATIADTQAASQSTDSPVSPFANMEITANQPIEQAVSAQTEQTQIVANASTDQNTNQTYTLPPVAEIQ